MQSVYECAYVKSTKSQNAYLILLNTNAVEAPAIRWTGVKNLGALGLSQHVRHERGEEDRICQIVAAPHPV